MPSIHEISVLTRFCHFLDTQRHNRLSHEIRLSSGLYSSFLDATLAGKQALYAPTLAALTDRPGLIPLAARYEYGEALALLLKQPCANPNVTLSGFTALHYACFSNDVAILRILLSAPHLDLMCRDETNRIALHHARGEAFELLKRAHYARIIAEARSAASADEVARIACIYSSDILNIKAAHIAAVVNEEAIQAICQQYASPQDRIPAFFARMDELGVPSEKDTPLDAYIKRALPPARFAPLSEAIAKENTALEEEFKELYRFSKDENLINSDTRTRFQARKSTLDKLAADSSALHRAAEKGYLRVTKALVRQGANINARDYILCTPLWRAAFLGHWEVVAFLLEQKECDPNLASIFGTSVLTAAKKTHHCETIIRLLLKDERTDQTLNNTEYVSFLGIRHSPDFFERAKNSDPSRLFYLMNLYPSANHKHIVDYLILSLHRFPPKSPKLMQAIAYWKLLLGSPEKTALSEYFTESPTQIARLEAEVNRIAQLPDFDDSPSYGTHTSKLLFRSSALNTIFGVNRDPMNEELAHDHEKRMALNALL